MKRIYGVGINDADYQVTSIVSGKRVACKFYKTWNDMLRRCYSDKRLKKFPTYKGCSVDPRWHSFMSFRYWMEEQEWDGNNLDKDLLIEGNKVYGSDTCLFVSNEVNGFLLERGNDRGIWPLGVSMYESGKFSANCGGTYLGIFETPEKAHEVYKSHKQNLAFELASVQTDKRVSNALIKRYFNKQKENVNVSEVQ